MTLEDAKLLTYGQIIYQHAIKNRDGTSRRWRINGKVKTWKRNPNKIYVPLKHGMYSYGFLDEHNVNIFSLSEKEPDAIITGILTL